MEYKLTYKECIAGIKAGKLLGLECGKCAAVYFPPRKICKECFNEELKIRELKKSGEIKTFTVVRVFPEGYDKPYILCMVGLDDGPYVIGRVINIGIEEAEMSLIGRRVSVDYETFPEDKFSNGEKVALAFSLL